MNSSGIEWAVLGLTWVITCAAVLVVVWHLRSKRKMEQMTLIHQKRMKAIEKGVPLPEFLELTQDVFLEVYQRLGH